VVVALSGGVDSSVSAALLVEQGFQVVGMMLRLWSEQGRAADNRCCTPASMAMARRVAAMLDIPFYVVDAQQEHYEQVVRSFIDGYAQGITPNPCLACNSQVRWGFLLERARLLGATHMATGHYARLRKGLDGKFELLAARDPAKDQSYVLHVLNQNQLSQALFPVGYFTKDEVREMARRFGLPAAERPDSQDLCFLGGDDYRDFLVRNAADIAKPGPMFTKEGDYLGSHRGLPFYTIGQRKGLGIAPTKPLYVIGKELATNTLIVGPAEELEKRCLTAARINWISGSAPDKGINSLVKIRYKAQPAPATVTPLIYEENDEKMANVVFDQPQRGITPGQSAVFYDDEVCLGGGIIQ
jgi:tRNA-specific 2-thiouridylase